MSTIEAWTVERARCATKGAELRASRQAAGLILQELADLLGHPSCQYPVHTDAAELSRIETGQLIPRFELAMVLTLWMQDTRLQTPYSPSTAVSGISAHIVSPTPARATHPDTSRKAMSSVNRETAWAIHQWIIERLESWDELTHEQMWDLYQVWQGEGTELPRSSQSGLRTRVSELVRGGVVRDSGQTQTMTTGRQAILWTLTDPNRAVRATS